jgi:hypothetical protein
MSQAVCSCPETPVGQLRQVALCEARFDTLRARLHDDEKQLVRLEGETRHLVRSLSALTKALWAAALSIFGVLLGFAVWYIQHLA